MRTILDAEVDCRVCIRVNNINFCGTKFYQRHTPQKKSHFIISLFSSSKFDTCNDKELHKKFRCELHDLENGYNQRRNSAMRCLFWTDWSESTQTQSGISAISFKQFADGLFFSKPENHGWCAKETFCAYD